MPDDEQKQVYLILDALIRDYKAKKLTQSKQQSPAHGQALFNGVKLKAYLISGRSCKLRPVR